MATDDKDVNVKITGDSTGAVEAMKKTAGAVEDGVERIKGAFDNVGGAFGKIQGYFAALVAVVGGGKFFKEAINESNKLTGETMRLARTLGITAEEATTLNTALGDIYTDADTYIGSFQRFAQQLRRNEDGLQAMGLQTRDAAGHLRNANDVFTDGIKLVGQYKPGLDQTTAAQKLFGRSIDDVMKLQKLNNQVLEDAKQKNEELGLVITDQNVAASKAYKAAMNDVGDVMTAVMKVVGDAVMPVFTELAEYLARTGPYVVAVFKGALTGLIVVFRTVQAVVKTVAAVIFEFINATMDQLSSLGTLIGAVLSGDFAKAGDAAIAMKNRMVQSFRNIKEAAIENFVSAQDSVAESLMNIWGPKKAATVQTGKGTKQMGDLKEDKSKEHNLQKVDAALEDAKVTYQMTHDLREMSKTEELLTYKELLGKYRLTEEEKVQAAKRVSGMRIAIMREARQEELALSELGIEREKAVGLDRVDAVRQEAKAKADIGMITNLQMLGLEAQLEEERYQITRKAVADRLELLKSDPTKNVIALQKLNDELDQVEREHSMRQRGITLDQQKEQLKDWQSFFNNIGSSFGNVVQGLVTRTMTLGQAVRTLFAGLLASVGQFLAQIVAKKVAAWATEKVLASSSIGANAAVAGSGAAASQASIPFVGPVLALAAMAAVFGAVMGMKGKASAKSGFDIPAGMNPLTQLHEREMVLPAEHADTIRGMGQQDTAPIHIHTSGGSFVHKDDLAEMLRRMNRKFVFR